MELTLEPGDSNVLCPCPNKCRKGQSKCAPSSVKVKFIVTIRAWEYEFMSIAGSKKVNVFFHASFRKQNHFFSEWQKELCKVRTSLGIFIFFVTLKAFMLWTTRSAMPITKTLLSRVYLKKIIIICFENPLQISVLQLQVLLHCSSAIKKNTPHIELLL